MMAFFYILNDGHPLITYLIIIVMLMILVLFIKQLLAGKNSEKTKALISSLGWFAIAWGFLGRTLGLIDAFDAIQASGELTPSMVSDGIKMALVGPLVGVVTFIIARVCMIILITREKKELTE
jgi:mannose/fructose/N-acetylgalactosamine-specific phosphotransferase system component IID